MPVSQVWNGETYTLPLPGDNYGWGNGTTSYLLALGQAALSLAGGTFTLTGEVDFGATFGLKSAYFKSRGTSALTGVVRLGNTETISWRNAANSADLPLTVNASNQLTFNGVPLSVATGTVTSVSVAAGSSKLSSSGSPITTSGTITLDVVEANLTLNNIGGTLSVSKGGSGASTLTGYLKGNGTSAFTAVSSIPSSDITGTLGVANGGTGVNTLSAGFVYSPGGTSAFSTFANVDLTSQVTGTLPISSGGTGQTTAAGALNGLFGTAGFTTLPNAFYWTGDFSTSANRAYWKSNTGTATVLVTKAPGSTSSDLSGFRLNSSSDDNNHWLWSLSARNSTTGSGAHRLQTGKVTAGVTADSPDPIVFSGAVTGTVWAQIQAASSGWSSSASTELLRKADVPLTTKGDILTFTTVPARRAVGTDGYVLKADSTQATGLNWMDPRSQGQALLTSPTTGFSVTIGDQYSALILFANSGVVSSGTVTMPANPGDGYVMRIMVTSNNVTCTISPNTGQTVLDAPATINAGTGVAFWYYAGSSTWFRLY